MCGQSCCPISPVWASPPLWQYRRRCWSHGAGSTDAARIFALIVKELVGLWKDPKTRLVILVPPLVQVVIFAYSATYDVTQRATRHLE